MSRLQRVDFETISIELFDLIQSAESPVLVYSEDSIDWDCAHAAFFTLKVGIKRVRAVVPDDLDLADCNPLERSNLRRLSGQVDRLEKAWITHNPEETLELPVGKQHTAMLRESLRKMESSRDAARNLANNQGSQFVGKLAGSVNESRTPTADSAGQISGDNSKAETSEATIDLPLSQTKQDILKAFHEKKVVYSDHRVNATEIATAVAGLTADPSTFKGPLSELVGDGFLGSKTGRGGGYWLTKAGIDRAAKQ